jgi:hypothetical protein
MYDDTGITSSSEISHGRDRDARNGAGGGELQRERVPLQVGAPLDLRVQRRVLGEQDLDVALRRGGRKRTPCR